MRRLIVDQRGFGLVEQLMAMTLMGGVVGAILFTFTTFDQATRESNVRNEAQSRARVQVDALARELRNLASPTLEVPQAVDKAEAHDLVFQSVDTKTTSSGQNATNVHRSRYCLDTGGSLWHQVQRWTTAATPAAPSTTACPATGWASQTPVAGDVTNRAGGRTRPLFLYDSAVATAVTSVRIDLFVDSDITRAPRETRLSTGVFLRNQNRTPEAKFKATPTSNGNNSVLLNGSTSADPEGQALTYVWYDGADKIGTGITLEYAPGSSRCPSYPCTRSNVSLRVYDPAQVEGISATQSVVVA